MSANFVLRRFLSGQSSRAVYDGQSLAQLALQNLLPMPLPLVKRVNRFAMGASVPIVDFQRPKDPPVGSLQCDWNMTNRPVRPDIFHWAVCYWRAGQRAGLACSKNRGRVSGGGRKIYSQKGTGRARAGSSRAPQRRGGGVVFGPRPRDYSQDLPAKIRIRALFSALAMKYKNGLLRIVSEESLQLPSCKTKQLAAILGEHHEKTILIVDSEAFPRNLELAARSLPQKAMLFNCANEELPCHHVLKYKLTVLTRRAAEHLMGRFK